MKKPGEIAFTITPRAAHSAPSVRVSARTPCLCSWYRQPELEPAMGRDRGDVDDAAGPALPSQSARRPPCRRNDAGEVDGHDLLVIGAG